MAIYRMAAKAISRGNGRSATGSAAYRAGEEILDQKTGQVHDYSRKKGVEATFIVLPNTAPAAWQEWAAIDDKDVRRSLREEIWNAVEYAEKRKNSTVAREVQVALPHELGPEERQAIVIDFAKAIAEKHGLVVDVAIHKGGSRVGDPRNVHAHLLMSDRRIGPEGFGEKARELADFTRREHPDGTTKVAAKEHLVEWREHWADLVNVALERANRPERVDHRSNKDRGIEAEPQPTLSHKTYFMEKLHGIETDAGEKRRRWQLKKQLREQLEQLTKELANLVEQAKTKMKAVFKLKPKPKAEEKETPNQEPSPRDPPLVPSAKIDKEKVFAELRAQRAAFQRQDFEKGLAELGRGLPSLKKAGELGAPIAFINGEGEFKGTFVKGVEIAGQGYSLFRTAKTYVLMRAIGSKLKAGKEYSLELEKAGANQERGLSMLPPVVVKKIKELSLGLGHGQS